MTPATMSLSRSYSAGFGRSPNPQTSRSETTGRWLADLPRHGNPVGAVWRRLAELERAGHDPAVIAALRSLLLRHQPPRHGRCPACPRHL